MTRPLRLLFTKPACFAVSIFQAIHYAILYCFYAALPDAYRGQYGFSIQIAGVLCTSVFSTDHDWKLTRRTDIPMSIGAIIALAVLAVYVDKIYAALTKRNGNVAEPEFKLPLALLGGILAPIGIILFGWPAQYEVHWMVPSIGLLIFSGSILFPFLCVAALSSTACLHMIA